MCSETSLNHTFRSVWNAALGAMVAVPESASGGGGGGSARAKGSVAVRNVPNALALCVALAWGGLAGNAMANPEGGVVIAGQASMVTNGNQLLVTTQNAVGTNHSAINWQSFSIPAGSSTYFQQPTVASTVINQVVTSTPSLIFGTLGSNGNVVLVNQSGITVGAGAVVDTAGFTASALRMSDADARTGLLKFGDGSTSGGTVTVDGSVLARNGDVVLIAAHVETGKDALIQAPNGSTLLAAGQKIGITGRGLEGISLEVQAPADSAVNLGTLRGNAVGIFASTLKHSGAIQANAVSTEGGKVVLQGGSTLDVDGAVQARALGQRGGSILASAQHVVLGGAAVLDASGAMGGGEVLVGGGYQGHDARLANAQTTDVQSGAQLKADALSQGDGGTVVVWSDGATRYAGAISAQGGATGGNGGRAEVSGKDYLDYKGLVDLRAANGRFGSLLLDPADLTIDNTGYGGTISQSTINSTLASVGSLTLQATNDITVSENISYSGNSASLTLDAGHDIVFSASGLSIDSYSNPLNITLKAGNAIAPSSGYGVSINSKGGNISLQAGTGGIGASTQSQMTLNSGGDGSAGAINITSGGILKTGSINANGYGGGYNSSNGFSGGSVNINANGTVTISGISATGGSGDYSGQTNGGSGGSGSITAGSGSTFGTVDVSGGSGYGGGVAGTGGSGSLTVTSGDLMYGSGGTISGASSVSLKASAGAITQSSAITANSLSTSSSGDTTLTSPNTVADYTGTVTGSGNLDFTAHNGSPAALNISGINVASGNVSIDNYGATTTSGKMSAGGTLRLEAHSPLTIGTGGVTAGGGVTLTASTNLTLNGTIQSTGGGITLAATGGNLVQNSGVIAAGGVTATAGGAMSFGPNGYSSGSPLSYSDASGSVSPPLVPLSALTNTGGTVSDFLDEFLAALDAQNTFSDDPFDPRNRRTAGLVVEGQICTP
jgi:filamentous hemagglutinin family protein